MATKRVNGEGCIRKKDATHWEARITLSRDPVTKKQKIKAFYGKSRKEVKAKMDAFMDELEEKKTHLVLPEFTPEGENDMLLSDWLETWHKTYLADVKGSTKANYKSIIDNHIAPVLGDYPLSKLKAPVIQEFYNQLKDDK